MMARTLRNLWAWLGKDFDECLVNGPVPTEQELMRLIRQRSMQQLVFALVMAAAVWVSVGIIGTILWILNLAEALLEIPFYFGVAFTLLAGLPLVMCSGEIFGLARPADGRMCQLLLEHADDPTITAWRIGLQQQARALSRFEADALMKRIARLKAQGQEEERRQACKHFHSAPAQSADAAE